MSEQSDNLYAPSEQRNAQKQDSKELIQRITELESVVSKLAKCKIIINGCRMQGSMLTDWSGNVDFNSLSATGTVSCNGDGTASVVINFQSS